MGRVGGIGAKLLTKMGWKEGASLGISGDGLTEPLKPIRRLDKPGYKRGAKRNAGLGHKKASDKWWDQLMIDAYGVPKNNKTADIFSACEGRRCRPHGTAKLARLDKQESAAKLNSNELEQKRSLEVGKKANLCESIPMETFDAQGESQNGPIQLNATKLEVEDPQNKPANREKLHLVKHEKKIVVKVEKTILKKRKRNKKVVKD